MSIIVMCVPFSVVTTVGLVVAEVKIVWGNQVTSPNNGDNIPVQNQDTKSLAQRNGAKPAKLVQAVNSSTSAAFIHNAPCHSTTNQTESPYAALFNLPDL